MSQESPKLPSESSDIESKIIKRLAESADIVISKRIFNFLKRNLDFNKKEVTRHKQQPFQNQFNLFLFKYLVNNLSKKAFSSVEVCK